MKIRDLILKNLGPHVSTELELAPVNVFLGPNGMGKSFVLDALHVLRYGTCRDGEVGQSAELTRRGSEDGWALEARIGDERLRRTRSQAPTQGVLEHYFGDPRLLKSLLDVGRFLGLKASERKELVAGLRGRPTEETLEKLVKMGFRDENATDHEVLEAVRRGNQRRAHALCQKERRALDNDVERVKATAEAKVPDPDVQTAAGTKRASEIPVEAAQAGLATARKRLEAWIAYGTTVADRNRTRASADRARTALAGLGAAPEFTKDDAEALERARTKLNGTLQLVGAAKARRDARAETADALKALLETKGAACPICAGPLDAAKAAAEASLKQVGKERKEAEADVARLDAEAAADRQAVTSLESAQRGISTRREQWDRDARGYKDAIAAADALGPDPAAPEGVSLEKARADVARLEAIERAASDYATAAKAKAEAADELEKVAEEAAIWKDAEEACRPDAVEDEAGALGALNGHLSEPARVLLGDAKALRVTDAWEVEIFGARAGLASKSERMRAGFALAIALSLLSGKKIAVLDDLESVVGASRGAVLRLLGSLVASQQIDTALLACAQAERKPGPAAPWLRYFWVDRGDVRPMQEEAA